MGLMELLGLEEKAVYKIDNFRVLNEKYDFSLWEKITIKIREFIRKRL